MPSCRESEVELKLHARQEYFPAALYVASSCTQHAIHCGHYVVTCSSVQRSLLICSTETSFGQRMQIRLCSASVADDGLL